MNKGEIMTNKEKYIKAFADTFEIDQNDIEKMKYRESDQWDSIGHMSLISALEDEFGIEFEPDEIRKFHSYDVGISILLSKGIEI